MKKSFPFIFLFFISLSAVGQITFDWEEQLIKEDQNMKKMNVLEDNSAILIGYGNTFRKSTDQGASWNQVPLLDPVFDWADISINSSGLGYAVTGDDKVIDNPSGGDRHQKDCRLLYHLL